MKSQLEIGTTMSGEPFTLPPELVTRTLADIGIRGSGKTVAATVIAEEMCEAGLPWVALDPVGVWWGLRANRDGSPGGYPVVILGGEHADIPLEKSAGARVADAILDENVSCVVDLSQESKTTWRHFVAEFCDRLMELRPETPRHIFLEEAPEFVPQKPMGEQKRSLAAVDRLIRLGRNRGYGATIISQRYATVNKDVLTQCECLLALRSIGKPDREASRDWIAECVGASDSDKKAAEFMDSLTTLESGQGWFWSPQWLNVFQRIRIRQRKTYHPGETREVGRSPKQVQLSDVGEFVSRFGKALTRDTSKPKAPARESASYQPAPLVFEASEGLRTENTDLRAKLSSATMALAAVRSALEPQYRAMQKLFGDLESAATSSNGHVDAGVYEPWKAKLGEGCGRMIDALVQRGKLTTAQLGTLAGLAPRSVQNNLQILRRNGLVETLPGLGGGHKLRPL